MAIPRWKEIAQAVAADIKAGRLAAGTLLPSETELAAQWNVSRVTAHRAMYELQLDGVVVRKRRVGTVVSTPVARRTGRIAVFLNTRDLLEQEYLTGIQAALPDEYDLILCDIRCEPEREASYLERMRDSTDGILCIPTCDPTNTERLNSLVRSGANIVCIDCAPDGVETDAFISDNYGASLEALRFLTERGHRRIAHFTVNRMAISSLRERSEAYIQVLHELDVAEERRWLREFPYDVTWAPTRPHQAIEDALSALMHLPDRPTAMFCAHDYILSPVLMACRKLGIAIPEDLEIVSFNDCPPFVPYLPDAIHRIVQQARTVGTLAANHLFRLHSEGRHSPVTVRVAPVFHAGVR